MKNGNEGEEVKRLLGYIASAFWAILLLVYCFALVLSDIDEFVVKIIAIVSIPVYIALMTFYYARIHTYWCKKIDEKYNNNE